MKRLTHNQAITLLVISTAAVIGSALSCGYVCEGVWAGIGALASTAPIVGNKPLTTTTPAGTATSLPADVRWGIVPPVLIPGPAASASDTNWANVVNVALAVLASVTGTGGVILVRRNGKLQAALTKATAQSQLPYTP